MIRGKKEKAYWFYIDPFVHIAIKQDRVLFYNTLNGKALEYKDNPGIMKIARALLSKKNLLVIKLTREYLDTHPEINRFIRKAIHFHMGDLLDASRTKGKPIQMMPMANVQRDVRHLKKEPSRSVGEGIMNYLDEVSFYINSGSTLPGKVFRDGYRQFPCCLGEKGKSHQLNIEDIIHLLDEAGGSTLSLINILGGNVFEYDQLTELSGYLQRKGIETVFHVQYGQFIEAPGDKLKLLNFTSSRTRVLVDFPVERDTLECALRRLGEHRTNYFLEFIVQKTEDVAEALALVEGLELQSYSFQPYYNGRNLGFFKKNVFVTRKMVLVSKPSLEEILARQLVNPVNFGRITVLPTGDVHANVNMPKLGRLEKDSLYKMLYREMWHGRSWRRLRSRVIPCQHCVFELLCPPLSNYELALGRNNLCHIWKNQER